MPAGENDRRLLQGASGGNFDLVKAALQAGASVDGPPEQPCAPIVAATIADHAGIIELLLEHGADPDRPVTEELPHPTSDMAAAVAGERALHIATRNGNIEIVRLLLEQARANPNATDDKGGTPLLAACDSSNIEVEVVRLLLEAGADQTLAGHNGYIPLHMVALNGSTRSVDMLYSSAPATLNRCTPDGMTPLCAGCSGGHESMVSKLLSLGATQPERAEQCSMSPLTIAVKNDFMGVVKVLVNEGGIMAVGGETALNYALWMAIRVRRPRILRLLLTLDGHQGRSKHAEMNIDRVNLLGVSALAGYPAAVSVLLEAGADETALDPEVRYPQAFNNLCLETEVHMGRGRAVAIGRMLQHGPAYRARSWTWPYGENIIAGGNDDGDNGSGAGAATSVVFSPPRAVNFPPVAGAKIVLPNGSSGSKVFVRSIGR